MKERCQQKTCPCLPGSCELEAVITEAECWLQEMMDELSRLREQLCSPAEPSDETDTKNGLCLEELRRLS